MRDQDQDQESDGLVPLLAAKLREQAAAMADAALIMAGFELPTDPETPTEEPTTPSLKSSRTT